eukprot:2095367-Rhodomonas_salina.1
MSVKSTPGITQSSRSTPTSASIQSSPRLSASETSSSDSNGSRVAVPLSFDRSPELALSEAVADASFASSF